MPKHTCYLAFCIERIGKIPGSRKKNLIKAKQLDPLSLFMKAAWAQYYYYSRNIEKLETLQNNFNLLGGVSQTWWKECLCIFLKKRI